MAFAGIIEMRRWLEQLTGQLSRGNLRRPRLNHMVSLSATACLVTFPQLTLAQNIGEGDGDDQRSAEGFSPPAEKFSVSPGGVDMRTGAYTFSNNDISIGEDNETGGLSLTRILPIGLPNHKNPFGNLAHNWDIFITEESIDIDAGDYRPGSGPDQRIKIRFGGRSDTFQRKIEEPQFTQISYEMTGKLTFTGTTNPVFTYTAKDGTKVVFRAMGYECGGNGRCAFASSITHTDGTRFDLTYDDPTTGQNDTRLRRVVSNRGYALQLEYGSGAQANLVTKTCTLNLARAALPTSYDCPSSAQASVQYQYVSFTGPVSFGGTHYRLSSYTDPVGEIWTYQYVTIGSQVEMRFFDPGEATPRLVNTLEGVSSEEDGFMELVRHQELATGETYQYYWDEKPASDALNPGSPSYAGGRFVDASGSMAIVEFGFHPMPGSFNPGQQSVNYGDIFWQVTPGPERIVDQLGNETTNDYCDPNAAANLPPQENHRCLVTMKQSTSLPEGQKVEYTYQSRDTKNLIEMRTKTKPGTTGNDIVQSSTFSNCQNLVTCAKPLSVTDANGNTTSLVYDQVHGGVLKKTSPANGNGIRPEVRYSYGQSYAWLKSVSGFEQASTPIWLLLSEEYCRTSAADANGNCAAGAADEVVTTYEYEQGNASQGSNILLIGTAVTADGETLRTCYGYDANGRKISETQPKAGLAACPS